MSSNEIDSLPPSWTLTDIGTAYDVVGGGTPSTANIEYWDGQIPWITSADITGVRRIAISRYVTPKGIEESATNLVPPRSLLVVTRVGLGKIAISDQPICFSQDLQGLVQDVAIVLPEYTLYFLSFELQRLKFEGRGTTISGLTKKQLKDTKFPMPPRKEQQRIVNKIEELFSELDKGIESLKTAREQLKVYRQAVLKHAFEGKLTEQWRGENRDKLESANKLLARIKHEREACYEQRLEEWKSAVKEWEVSGRQGKKPGKPRKHQPIELPDISLPTLASGWAWECLGNLNVDVFDGPFGSNLKTSDYVDEGVRVVRLENIGFLEFIEGKDSYVTEEKYETIRKHTVHDGDLIFSSFIKDGIRVTILPDYIDRAVNKADCFCVRPHGGTVRGDYLAYFLSTRLAFKQIESEIHGIGRPRINTTQLKSFAIPICSPQEQREIMSSIADKLSIVDHMDSATEKEMDRCEALRQAILKRAFSGHLVEQDPNDEPASVLLARIKAKKDEQSKNMNDKKMKDAA